MGAFSHLRDTLRRQAGAEAYEDAVAANGGPEGHTATWHRAAADVGEAVHAFLPGTRTAAYYLAQTANTISGDTANEWR